MYINGHFCYADKFAILTNGLGIVRHISFLDDDAFKSAHPELPVEKKPDSPVEDKSVGDSSSLCFHKCMWFFLFLLYCRDVDIHNTTVPFDNAFWDIPISRGLSPVEKKPDSPVEDKSVGDSSSLVPVLTDYFSLHFMASEESFGQVG